MITLDTGAYHQVFNCGFVIAEHLRGILWITFAKYLKGREFCEGFDIMESNKKKSEIIQLSFGFESPKNNIKQRWAFNEAIPISDRFMYYMPHLYCKSLKENKFKDIYGKQERPAHYYQIWYK